MTPRDARSGTGAIYWSGASACPHVILLHGLAGSHEVWDRLTPLLNNRCRVGAIHPRGGCSIEHKADRAVQLLERAETPPALIVGHSMGGLIATAMAERRPDLVTAITLINSPPNRESRIARRSVSRVIVGTPVLGAVAWSAAGTDAKIRGLRSAVAPGAPVPEQLLSGLNETTHREYVRSERSINRYLETNSLPRRLAALRVPIGAVFGLQDQRVDPACVLAYREVRAIRVWPIENSGHSPQLEEPHAVAPAILELLDTVHDAHRL
jgi:pimeloyl-ACP methyl ester carboxylesterase